MRKLVKGIVEFRRKGLPDYLQKFSRLAAGQSPDTLFIACSDSRVVPNLFASTDPGDLFVIRNVGNLIPCCDEHGHSVADESEAAAVEFAIGNLKVKDIIVCGHSECGAMQAILNGRQLVPAPNLRAWLRHGEDALDELRTPKGHGLSPLNVLSQRNVLAQLDHLRTYPLVIDQIKRGQLRIHGWWFDLETASVLAYDQTTGKFELIDEAGAEKILSRMNS
ncbi:MAG: carbonic anhydrase [Bdellovibrionales bacterium]